MPGWHHAATRLDWTEPDVDSSPDRPSGDVAGESSTMSVSLGESPSSFSLGEVGWLVAVGSGCVSSAGDDQLCLLVADVRRHEARTPGRSAHAAGRAMIQRVIVQGSCVSEVGATRERLITDSPGLASNFGCSRYRGPSRVRLHTGIAGTRRTSTTKPDQARPSPNEPEHTRTEQPTMPTPPPQTPASTSPSTPPPHRKPSATIGWKILNGLHKGALRITGGRWPATLRGCCILQAWREAPLNKF